MNQSKEISNLKHKAVKAEEMDNEGSETRGEKFQQDKNDSETQVNS